MFMMSILMFMIWICMTILLYIDGLNEHRIRAGMNRQTAHRAGAGQRFPMSATRIIVSYVNPSLPASILTPRPVVSPSILCLINPSIS